MFGVKVAGFLAAFLGMGQAMPSAAQAAVLNQSGSGWCNPGTCNNSDPNVAANNFAGTNYIDWFSFSLPSGIGTFTSATLSIWQHSMYTPGFFPEDTWATFKAPSISSSAMQAASSGTKFGSILYSETATGTSHYVDIVLNAAGLSALTASEGSMFIFGGITATSNFFGATNGSPGAYLTYTTAAADVPEPATAMLVGTGLAGAMALRRRKKG